MVLWVAVAAIEALTPDIDESEPSDSKGIYVLLGNILIYRNIMGGKSCLKLLHG